MWIKVYKCWMKFSLSSESFRKEERDWSRNELWNAKKRKVIDSRQNRTVKKEDIFICTYQVV